MRERLLRCGGVPRWEGGDDIWTMPHEALMSVVAELVELFGEIMVSVQVGPDRRGGAESWVTVRLEAGLPVPALLDLLQVA